MKTKETILKDIFRNDPFGILGKKTMPIEARDLLIEKLSESLNRSEIWEDFKIQISLDFPNIELNGDSVMWNEIEEFIVDKIIEDNEIKVME